MNNRLANAINRLFSKPSKVSNGYLIKRVEVTRDSDSPIVPIKTDLIYIPLPLDEKEKIELSIKECSMKIYILDFTAQKGDKIELFDGSMVSIEEIVKYEFNNANITLECYCKRN